jgi:hypothetical protein
MNHRLTLAIALVLLGWSTPATAAGRPGQTRDTKIPEASTEREETPTPLRLLRASYEIDVLGSLAVGELVREFASDTAADVTAASVGEPPGLSIEKLTIEIAGRTQELRTPADHPKKGRKSGSSRAGRQRSGRAEPPQPAQAIHVEAGEPLIVRSTFRMALPIRDGRFLLRLPAVREAAPSAATTEAEDALPSGPLGTITISIHHEEPLLHAESQSHDVITAYEGDHTVVELAEGESESREFEFEFALGVEDDSTLMGQVTPTDDGAYEVVVVLTPPMEPGEGAVRPKQVLFVLDSSGSMAKGKLDQARVALATCLEAVRPDDLFNIVAFKDEYKMMNEEPVSGEGPSRERAVAWLRALRPGGGTQLLPALGATFEQPESDAHHRMIVLLTDGALQDRREVLEPLKQGLGEARLFVIGIGEDVTRETILHLAEYGRGLAVFADDPEGLEAIMAAMFTSVSDPLAWDLELDWGGAEVESMEPARLGDLYAGRPVTVRARIRGELPEQLRVEATTTGGLRQFTTTLKPSGAGRRSKLAHP